MVAPPDITGDEIRLRPYIDTDVAALTEAAMESISHLNPWMPWCHPAYSERDSIGWIKHTLKSWASGDEFNFVIVDKTSDRLLGGCGLNKLDKEYRCANLGYWVRKGALGRGIAPQATRLLARYALGTLSFNRLEILVAEGNLASQRAATKAGARCEGVARKRLLIHGTAHDAVVFSLVAGDFP